MSAQNQYQQKNRYEEIVDSFKQVSDNLQEVKSKLDPATISFIDAHLNWILDQIQKVDDIRKILTGTPAACGDGSPRIPSLPPKKKTK